MDYLKKPPRFFFIIIFESIYQVDMKKLSNEPKTFFPISRLYIPTVTVKDFNTAMEFCLAIDFGHLEDTKV